MTQIIIPVNSRQLVTATLTSPKLASAVLVGDWDQFRLRYIFHTILKGLDLILEIGGDYKEKTIAKNRRIGVLSIDSDKSCPKHYVIVSFLYWGTTFGPGFLGKIDVVEVPISQNLVRSQSG